MRLRKSSLPEGWYPKNAGDIFRFLSEFAIGANDTTVRAVIAPHAGWSYSGGIAAKAVARLDGKADTLAVIGGHLPAGRGPLFAMEDSVETPLGEMPMDAELRAAMIGEIGGREDRFPDNTVEVLLPMARFFFPKASLLWLRLPADMSAFKAGGILAAVARGAGRKLAVLASADLTHYGRGYGFAPMGTGPEALRWVREVNDRRLLDAVVSGDPAAALERAETEHSTCSAGAMLGAMGFARAMGTGPARVIEYGAGSDAEKDRPPEAFVGYAAVAFGGTGEPGGWDRTTGP